MSACKKLTAQARVRATYNNIVWLLMSIKQY